MPVKTIIHTIRHGHTSYNAEKRYAGTIDIPLSEKGIKDCREVSKKLARYPIDVVVTSAMKRTIETARLLAPGKPKIIQTALCNERRFGIMEGHTWKEVVKFDPPVLMIDVGNDLHTVNPKNGEPFEDVWQRAKNFRNFLFKNHKGKNVLVVSHGVFLQMFHGVLKGLNCIESLAVMPSNLELSSFHFSGNRLTEAKIVKLNQADTEKF
jgi:2,3-bisphosphoglycerate-dependent phosphoglycerate mutase